MKAGDEPYDPDLTVQEALELGLIAVIDSGSLGSQESCNERLPWRIERRKAVQGQALRCTRNRGHEGVHAVVLRSELTADELAEQERAAEALERRLKAVIVKAVDTKLYDDWRALDREASMMYGDLGSKGQKKDQFRDKNAGKVKGPR